MSGYIGNIPVPQATQTRDNFTATSGQTTFSTSGYTPSYLDVYLNGVHLDPSDYTATNGTDVVLGTGATAGDIVSVVAFSTFETVDQDFSGDFSVDGSTFVVDSTNDRVGIGTSSPGQALHIKTTADESRWIQLQNDSTTLYAGVTSSGYAALQTDDDLTFHTGGSWAEHMRLNSSGKLGIGTDSPDCPVTIKAGNNSYVGGGISIEQAAGSVKSYITHAGDNFYISNGGTTDQFILNPNGQLRVPYQPSFAANRSTNSFTVNASTKITQDREIYDVGGCYNPSLSRFTAPVAGKYLFTLDIIYRGSYNNGHISYYVNGSSPGNTTGMNRHFSDNEGSVWHTISMTDIIPLNAGDYVEVWNGGLQVEYHGNSWNRWSGQLLA